MSNRKLSEYAEMLNRGEVCYKGTKTIVEPNSCNLRGFALELAVADYYGQPLEISNVGQMDIIFYDEEGRKHFMEVKSNSSPLDGVLNRSKYISYVPFVDLDGTLSEQIGYVIKLKKFFDIGMSNGHIKPGTTRGGAYTVEYKTQTVYNYSKMAFHGKKWFKLAELYAQNGGLRFDEWYI